MLFMHVDNPGGNGGRRTHKGKTGKKTNQNLSWRAKLMHLGKIDQVISVNMPGQRAGPARLCGLTPPALPCTSSCVGKARQQRPNWFHKFWLLLTNHSITPSVCSFVCLYTSTAARPSFVSLASFLLTFLRFPSHVDFMPPPSLHLSFKPISVTVCQYFYRRYCFSLSLQPFLLRCSS